MSNSVSTVCSDPCQQDSTSAVADFETAIASRATASISGSAGAWKMRVPRLPLLSVFLMISG